MLACAVACSQIFDVISLVGICPLAILVACKTVRSNSQTPHPPQLAATLPEPRIPRVHSLTVAVARRRLHRIIEKSETLDFPAAIIRDFDGVQS